MVATGPPGGRDERGGALSYAYNITNKARIQMSSKIMSVSLLLQNWDTVCGVVTRVPDLAFMLYLQSNGTRWSCCLVPHVQYAYC
jgi:hypothetical protein